MKRMLKLSKCKFQLLEGIEELNLDFSKITTLTGPNGTGKSTVLRALDLALRIVELNDIYGELPSHELWHLFESVELTFESEEVFSTEIFGDVASIDIFIECDSSTYFISTISSNGKSYSFRRPMLSSSLSILKDQVGKLEDVLSELNAKIDSHDDSRIKDLLLSQQEDQRQEIERKKAKLTVQILEDDHLQCDSIEDGFAINHEISRSWFREFLFDLSLPSVRLITTENLMQQNISALINRLVVLKKGAKSKVKEFKEREELLNELLRSEIDVLENGDKQLLFINGTPYHKASTGTYLTLAFFAITDSEDPNKVILWDEPENGLHPTRRTQLLELMGRDPRQFVLATHATEFAPVLQSDCKVYRCVSDYDEENSHFQFSVVEVACRREAFKTLEALGISPARTLFTANVVIWVEGPTELLFYRHWLAKRLEPKGYQEGLHYTFMQYGGSLINYLEAADDKEFKSTIDLLSHCRHPIVLVDSDLTKEVLQGECIEEHLKTGAQRLWREITILNAGRNDAAMFFATRGREIENYLPSEAIFHAVEKLWADFSKVKGSLNLQEFQLDPYEKYFDSLGQYFIDNKIVDKDNKPKGRSIWGADNKVSMMAMALTMPNFDESKLLLDCGSHLQKIEKFIIGKHAVGYPTVLKN